MSARNIIEIEEVRKRLTYDPITGLFFSKRARRNVGARTGAAGYLCIWIKNQRYLCHRLAWAMHYGYWVDSPAEIDHINGRRDDNRLANLRMVSRQVQMRNLRVGKRNTTGTLGVHFCNQTGNYSATIVVGRKQIWLGRHDSLDKAIAARRAAEVLYGWPS